MPPAQGNNYGARNLVDGNDDTAWVEGSSGQGAGDFVVVEFDTPRTVRGVTVRNGYDKNADIFGKNSRVKDVELIFSSGDSLQATLTDQAGAQHVSLNRRSRPNGCSSSFARSIPAGNIRTPPSTGCAWTRNSP
jgi:uncharacterized protein (DUF1330 family)